MMCILRSFISAILVIFSVGLALPGVTGATVITFTNETAFTAVFKPVEIAIPDSATAFPSEMCGQSMTGSGLSVTMGFGANSVTVSAAPGNGLCIFDKGAVITPTNTIPDTMIANTIVANGEDDFRLVFMEPISAIGFRLLTNNLAQEIASFYDANGLLVGNANIDKFTDPNVRQFIGVFSTKAFSSLVIDTNNGALQNEGFDRILIGTRVIGTPVPEPSSLVFLVTGLILARQYRTRRTAL